ncbi:O-antigen ligase family protein [Oceanicaulis alexandrii]|uniref:O-antigen ligase family protein n=1 Tax=Oceanicaulis alexandrii TaxID=153233 RepID=UPI00235737B2|nr:hypothetical protein [Oceanicaulis alexandrii]
MNLSILIMIPFAALTCYLLARRSAYLLTLWMFLILAFPTTRSMIGPIPIYWYDIVAVASLVMLLAEPGLIAAQRSRFLPHWVFIAVVLVTGTILPFARYGVHAELVWNFLHTALAIMGFVVGFALVLSRREGLYVNRLLIGFAAGAAILFIAAIYQRSGPAGSAQILDWYYGDFGTEFIIGEFQAYLRSTRAAAGMQHPNTLGVAMAVTAMVSLIVGVRRRGMSRLLSLIVIGLCLVTLVLSASRQALLGLMIFGTFAGILTASGRARQTALALSLVGALVLVATGGAGMLDRLSGLFADQLDSNVAARIIDGPERLMRTISENPSVLLIGAGHDVTKLARLGTEVGDLDQGFSSNGFLLSLYYYGVFGFILILATWLLTIRRAWMTRGPARPPLIGASLALAFFFFADNHGLLAEELMTLIFLTTGLIYGAGLQRLAAGSSPIGLARPEQSRARAAGRSGSPAGAQEVRSGRPAGGP